MAYKSDIITSIVHKRQFVQAYIDISDLDEFKEGDHVAIKLPYGFNKTLTGKVKKIYSISEIKDNTLLNKTLNDNKYGVVIDIVLIDGSYGPSQAYAEYVNVPVSELALKPAGIDHIHAAGAPKSLLTAWQFMVEVGHDEPNPLQPNKHIPVPLEGKTVLINGAGSGVGHFAVQIAKRKGARVIAVASGRQEELLRELGADEFIDYTKTNADEILKDIDLVIDAVGGPKTGRFLKTLKPGGSLFPIFPLGFSDHDEAERLGVKVSATQVRSNGRQLSELATLLDHEIIRVVIDSTFPLAQARQAHERAALGHIQGKIVLTVDQ